MEMNQSKFKRICVFCGSSPGKKSSYKDAAIDLGEELVTCIYDLRTYSLTFQFGFFIELARVLDNTIQVQMLDSFVGF